MRGSPPRPGKSSTPEGMDWQMTPRKDGDTVTVAARRWIALPTPNGIGTLSQTAPASAVDKGRRTSSAGREGRVGGRCRRGIPCPRCGDRNPAPAPLSVAEHWQYWAYLQANAAANRTRGSTLPALPRVMGVQRPDREPHGASPWPITSA